MKASNKLKLRNIIVYLSMFVFNTPKLWPKLKETTYNNM